MRQCSRGAGVSPAGKIILAGGTPALRGAAETAAPRQMAGRRDACPTRACHSALSPASRGSIIMVAKRR